MPRRKDLTCTSPKKAPNNCEYQVIGAVIETLLESQHEKKEGKAGRCGKKQTIQEMAIGLVQRFDVSWDAPVSLNNLDR